MDGKRKGRKIFALIAATAVAVAHFMPALLAQAPPPAPYVTLRSPPELEQLLAPIALYPDPLLAEILSASTQPADVVAADRYVRQGADPNQIDLQPWSPSAKAMARYPNVLARMDDNITWTSQVGDAFRAQETEVMAAAVKHIDPARLIAVVVGDREKLMPSLKTLELGDVTDVAVQ